jgi:hypothetical protein
VEKAKGFVEFSKFSMKIFNDVVLANKQYVDIILNGPYSLKIHSMGLVDENNKVNFYDGQCPPPADAVATYVIPWGNVDAQLVLEQSPRTVYMVDALIDPPFLIESPNSIGIACLIGWTAQPWTGVCLTTPPAVYGCGECYWSYASAGYPRWTLIYAGIGMHADLAYSLWEPETGVPENEPVRQLTTWGRVKTLYR